MENENDDEIKDDEKNRWNDQTENECEMENENDDEIKDDEKNRWDDQTENECEMENENDDEMIDDETDNEDFDDPFQNEPTINLLKNNDENNKCLLESINYSQLISFD